MGVLMKTPIAVMVIVGKILMTVVVIFTLLFLGMTALILLGSVWFGGLDVNHFLQLPWMNRAILVLSPSASIAAAMLMYFLFEGKRRWSLGWRQENRWQAALEGAYWGMIMMSISFLVIWLFGGIRVISFIMGPGVIEGLLLAVFVFALVAVGEELLCRGYWYGLIRKDLGPKPAILGTSVVFAGLHLLNSSVLQSPVPLVNLVLAGVLLGVSREVTGGLWLPIGIHFTWNLFQGNIFGFAVSGLHIESSVLQIETVGPHLISGGSFGAEGSLVTTVLLVLFTFIIAWWYQKRSSLT